MNLSLDIVSAEGGNTALMVCASEGNIDNAEMQLANGADINARNKQGATALLIAVLNNQPTMVSFLLGKGANASIASKKGLTPVALAKKNANTEIIRLLENHSKNEIATQIKWLLYWTYFQLPLGSLILLLAYIKTPTVISMVISFPIIFLQCAVIYGIHHRKLWAWKWNWTLILFVSFTAIFNPANPFVNKSGMGFEFELMLRIVVFALFWLWPNYVYWNKRKHLFS